MTNTNKVATAEIIEARKDVSELIGKALKAETTFFNMLTNAGAFAATHIRKHANINNEIEVVMACYKSELAKFKDTKKATSYFKNGLLIKLDEKSTVIIPKKVKGKTVETEVVVGDLLKSGTKADIEKAMTQVRDNLEVNRGLVNNRKNTRNTAPKVQGGQTTTKATTAKSTSPAIDARVRDAVANTARDNAIKIVKNNVSDAKFMAELKAILDSAGYKVTKTRKTK